MHEYFPEHLRMGTPRVKETEEKGNRIGMKMERSKAAERKNEVPTA